MSADVPGFSLEGFYVCLQIFQVFTGRGSIFRPINVLPRIAAVLSFTSLTVPLQAEEVNLLVVGVPNVGKSSFINHLRNSTLRRKGES